MEAFQDFSDGYIVKNVWNLKREPFQCNFKSSFWEGATFDHPSGNSKRHGGWSEENNNSAKHKHIAH